MTTLSRQLVSRRIGAVFAPKKTGDSERDKRRAELFRARRLIVDERYNDVSLELVRATLETDPVLKSRLYKRNVFDCDDWVLHLRAHLALLAANENRHYPPALGCLITKSHAFNFFFDEAHELNVINTQSDEQRNANTPEDIFELMNITAGNPLLLIYI